MANSTTLGDIREAAAGRVEFTVGENQFIGRWEANRYVNSVLSELHDILVTAYRDYFQETSTVALVADQESYDLPTNFYKALALFYVSGGRRYRVEQFLIDDLADYDVGQVAPLYSNEFLRYRIIGNKIYFTPKPTGSGSIELWFIPQFTKLIDPYEEDGTTPNGAYSAGDDVISYAVVNGWEEYAVTGTAIKMLKKEESDTTGLERELESHQQRIIYASKVRDAHRPQRVRDVYGGSRRGRGRRRGW